ncbi:MAG TPA: hypothetical protein VIM73_15440, partial [Polyangiaceae bacterium]
MQNSRRALQALSVSGMLVAFVALAGATEATPHALADGGTFLPMTEAAIPKQCIPRESCCKI